VCALGVIPSGVNPTIVIRVVPTVTGQIDNFADVTLGTGSSDPNILNNKRGVATTVIDSSATYSISGRIADSSNNGVAEVWVTLSGSQSSTTLTNGNGNYSFTGVPTGGFYEITPSKYSYLFFPGGHTISNLASNETANFTAALDGNISKRADFDGDGKTDISVFRPSEGNWCVVRSLTNTLQVVTWGLADDKLMPGDYDGDRKTDFAVWRTSDNVWYVLWNNGGTPMYIQWGLSTDIPVAGDYDGDGKTDIAVWRPSTGVWYILRSSDWLLQFKQFGVEGDVPLVGDFDNDRRSDLVVFNPSNAMWKIEQSTLGYKSAQFGLVTDKLAPADYDGD